MATERGVLATVDRATDGLLSTLVSGWRSQQPKVSFEEIAVRLRDHGVIVTGETVRRWWPDEATEPTEVAS